MGRRKNGEIEVSQEAKTRQIRVFLTPIQDAQLTDMRLQWGIQEAETIRRAIDFYLADMQAKQLYIPSPEATPVAIAAKRLKDIELAQQKTVGEDL